MSTEKDFADVPELQPRRPSVRERMGSREAWQTRVVVWAVLLIALLLAGALVPGDPATDCAVVEDAAAKVETHFSIVGRSQ